MTPRSPQHGFKANPGLMIYPVDLLADIDFRLMSLAERGLLLTLMCECWVNGSLPAEHELMSRILGFSREDFTSAFTHRTQEFFQEVNGQLICPGVEAYRAECSAIHNAKKEGGKKGANKRWKKGQVSEESEAPGGSPVGTPSRTPNGS